MASHLGHEAQLALGRAKTRKRALTPVGKCVGVAEQLGLCEVDQTAVSHRKQQGPGRGGLNATWQSSSSAVRQCPLRRAPRRTHRAHSLGHAWRRVRVVKKQTHFLTPCPRPLTTVSSSVRVGWNWVWDRMVRPPTPKFIPGICSSFPQSCMDAIPRQPLHGSYTNTRPPCPAMDAGAPGSA